MKRERLLGAASMLLGGGMALNALLGPLAFGVIRIRESSNMEHQLIGGELTSLLLAAPLAIVAGGLWWNGDPMAPFLGIGPAGFALYTYVQFVLVPDYTRYPGNNDQWFPLYLALVMLGWLILWRSWRELSARDIAPLDRRLARTLGAVLVACNACFAIAWWAGIAAVVGGERPIEYLEHPTAFWLVRLMDLGFVIPLGLVTGLSLFRRTRQASRLAYGYVGTQTLLATAVAGMALLMWIRNDPGVTAPMLGVSTAGAAMLAVLYGILIARRFA